MPHVTKKNVLAVFAIVVVVVLVVIGFLPFAGDDGNRRVLVFCYALAAVLLGLWKMILTIWTYRNDEPAALRASQERHQNTAALLDVFTAAFGAPAAFFGALSFLVSG